ncbi:MAG TPA: hypothetical protein VKR53_13300 [Puia sp.]|nr:hypothetical protein [Puia sp.]
MPIRKKIEVTINLPAIDDKIKAIEEEIQSLIADKKDWQSFRQKVILLGEAAANSKHIATNGKKRPKKMEGISKFILDFLQKGETPYGELLKAWGEKSGKTKEEIGNNLSNTLSRLRRSGKTLNKVNSRGRRFGSSWYLKN